MQTISVIDIPDNVRDVWWTLNEQNLLSPSLRLPLCCWNNTFNIKVDAFLACRQKKVDQSFSAMEASVCASNKHSLTSDAWSSTGSFFSRRRQVHMVGWAHFKGNLYRAWPHIFTVKPSPSAALIEADWLSVIYRTERGGRQKCWISLFIFWSESISSESRWIYEAFCRLFHWQKDSL